MPKTKVLIVDDHRIVVQGIKSALHGNSEYEVIGEANNGLQAIKKAESSKPDIIIMDISLPNLNGKAASLRIKELLPDARIIIFSMYSDSEYVIDLFKIGISAYVLKEDPLSDLIFAVNAVKRGGIYFSQTVFTILLKHMKRLEKNRHHSSGFESLSRREREIFSLLAGGMSIKDTAWELNISPKTVESHKYHIMEKLHVHTITDLTKIAIKRNLIKP